MDQAELKELKEQLKNLLDRVLSTLVLFLGVLQFYLCVRKMVPSDVY